MSLVGISSMATRRVLAELCRLYEQTEGGPEVRFESVGGVDAVRRIKARETFDLVVLAADAMKELIAAGLVHAYSACRIAESTVAIAVPAGSPPPQLGSEEALRRAVLAARHIGYSTGPSGTALLEVFDRWGLRDTLATRLVQAPPGVAVASLLASGQADLGFQQLSELQDHAGIDIVGGMPPGLEIVTTFVGGVGAASAQPVQALAALHFMSSASTADAKRRHGLVQPRTLPWPLP